MRKTTIFLTFLFIVFLGNTINAQEGVSKSELLNTLNDFGDMNFNKKQESALKVFNNKLVDKIFNITDSNKSNEDKILSLKNLRNDNKNKLLDILGEDNFKKFKKSMKKKLGPLKRKSKLLKFVI